MISTKNRSGAWYIILTILTVAIFLSAGCSSRQASKPDDSPANLTTGAIAQNMPSTTEIIAGTTEVSGQANLNEVSATKSLACPKLDSQLNQLTASADPIAMATSLNLPIREGKVQVRLLLASDDLSFLEKYDVEPGSRAGQEIQAYVPISRLCEVSNLEQVLTIRISAQGVLP